jgi:hypothetical protein
MTTTVRLEGKLLVDIEAATPADRSLSARARRVPQKDLERREMRVAAAAFTAAGYRVVKAYDSWPDAVAIYNHNAPEQVASTCDIVSREGRGTVKEDRRHLGDVDLLAAGPPCKGFSQIKVGLRVLRDATGGIIGQVFISDSLENGAGYASLLGEPGETEALLRSPAYRRAAGATRPRSSRIPCGTATPTASAPSLLAPTRRQFGGRVPAGAFQVGSRSSEEAVLIHVCVETDTGPCIDDSTGWR